MNRSEGRRHGPDDQHDHVGREEQQAGSQVELDVDAHDRHQAVRVVVVGSRPRDTWQRQRDRQEHQQDAVTGRTPATTPATSDDERGRDAPRCSR